MCVPTSRKITTAWLEARSLRTATQTYLVISKGIGACLTKLRTEGIAEARDYDRGIQRLEV